jgi:hypothetical protein
VTDGVMNFDGLFINMERDSLKGILDLETSWLSLLTDLILANSSFDAFLIYLFF